MIRCQAGPLAARAAILCALTLLFGRQGLAADVELRAGGEIVRIATVGGLPVQWMTCGGNCDEPDTRRRTIVGGDNGAMRWFADEQSDAEAMTRVVYEAQVTRNAQAVTAVLTARDSSGGKPLVQRYELSLATHILRASLRAPPGVGVRMSSGAGFVPDQMPGFGAAFCDVDVVRVTPSGQKVMESGEASVGRIGEIAVTRTQWLGIRSRFWAWLARPDGGDVAAVIRAPRDNQGVVEWRSPTGKLQLVFYAGPVAWKQLREVAPELTQLLFAALWDPLRWLCFALYFLLAAISGWVVNSGLAIILLSLAVKILLFPLTQIAESWQREVNRIQGRIQPKIAAIRKQFRGEEAHERTLQVYRDEGVHTLYPMKSLAGFAIQLPMFIAAFDMLADNFALNGAPFLWIDDLAAPDRLGSLPVALPFFGGDLNLLPVLMTAITVLSALVQRDESLTLSMLRRQQRQLYFMAGGFFLLFYTFPAGMVLYWTANNFWHLVKIQATQLMERR